MRKYLDAPDLEISEGGEATPEQMIALAEMSRRAIPSVRHERLLSTGATRGGIPFGRGALYYVLYRYSNRRPPSDQIARNYFREPDLQTQKWTEELSLCGRRRAYDP